MSNRILSAASIPLCALLLAACGGGSGTTTPPPPAPMPLMLTGNTTTFAGDGTRAVTDSTDGTGATAQFDFPRGITTDGTWLYLTESTGNRVRKIDPVTGETVTLAGGAIGFRDGTGAMAGFSEPRHITHHAGFLYLCDPSDERVRKVDAATGETTTLAGDGTSGFQDSTDGTGATAQFDRCAGITTDGTYLYVCDRENHRIRRVSLATGETTTLAGDGTAANAESTDGTGATASILKPQTVVRVGEKLYVTNESRILVVDRTTGDTAFLAGAEKPAMSPAEFQDSTDGTGATARFGLMLGISSDGFYLYVGDSENNRVRRVDILTGETTTLAGDGTQTSIDPMTGMPIPPFPFQDSTDGTGATARFNSPRASVAFGGALFVADGANHRVRKIE